MAQNALMLFPAAIPLAYLIMGEWLKRSPARWPLPIALTPLFTAVAAALCLAIFGAIQTPLLGIVGIGLSFHMDALSATLLLLVTFLGTVILHYSRQYLAGDPRHGEFMRDLCRTLAAVTTLVAAGNLYLLVVAWVGMSLCLNKLLLFRSERPLARLAAHKKFLLARLGDVALIAACGFLIAAFGTADLSALSLAIQSNVSQGDTRIAVPIAAGLLGLTAVLKSAQFPTHGWLVEVMETPTPVSALLHAGVVNAGGFLLLRFSDVLLAAPAVSLAIAGLGLLTAMVGTSIMLVQTDIKSSLAYSTVSQMGFMMLQCGLGAYSSAMLHLVGHSLYKAHAFLGSGATVSRLQREGWQAGARGSSWLSGLTLYIALAVLYSLIAHSLGSGWQEAPVVFSLGMIMILGLCLFTDAPHPGFKQTAMLLIGAVTVSLLYFSLQFTAAVLFQDIFSVVPEPTFAGRLLLVLLLIASALFALVQGRWPSWQSLAGLRVHLAQGLYINLLTNRWLGAYRVDRTSANLRS